jgi:transposase
MREALRVLMVARNAVITIRATGLVQIKALIVTAPDQLRDLLGQLPKTRLLTTCQTLRPRPNDPAQNATRLALRTLARTVQNATTDASVLEAEIQALVNAGWPGLLEQTGIGPVSAAQLIISYSHHGRCRSEAAFARLAGCAPIPASSGKTIRHRLDPGGDRQLNRAIHTIAIQRARHDPETRAYLDKKIREGKSAREARRCLKRHIARRLYNDLKNIPTPT